MMSKAGVIAGLALGAAMSSAMFGVASGPFAQQEQAGHVVEPPEGDLDCLVVVSADPEDAGLVPANSTLARTIVFGSVVRSPVKLEIVSKTCGCVSAEFEPPEVGLEQTTSLTMTTTAAPIPGEQSQALVFRASWIDKGVPRAQRGMVQLRYRTAVVFTVRPEAVSTVAVDGGLAQADIFVRSHSDDAPALDDGRCNMLGWSVRRMGDEGLPRRVVHFRAEGPAGPPGTVEGQIEWRTPGTPEPVLTVPLRVRTQSLWRSDPGGVVLTPPNRSEGRVLLVPRLQGAPRPARVAVEGACDGLGVSLESMESLAVRIDVSRAPAIGSARARVFAEDGRFLLDVPIAWYALRDATR